MEAEKPANSQLRLRVFAGPNGSGKSTIIKSIRDTESSGRKIDIGIYINADDIAKTLSEERFTFNSYEIKPLETDFDSFAKECGLLNDKFTFNKLKKSISFQNNGVILLLPEYVEQVAQLLARFLREELLKNRKRFSFETVFSHESNLDIMKRAAENGYKVYLYFVSTESPIINQYRVSLRKAQGGHDVPVDKIKSRYNKSLDLLYPASKIAYQVYFFDNSTEGAFRLIAHFKRSEAGENWDSIENPEPIKWFKKYYTDKESL